MKRIIYMLDTNVLCDWMTACNPQLMAEKHFVRPERARQIRAFCENNENRICIPDLVWAEFLSVMLHKDIDVSGDFAKTRQWVRNQETMVQQIELMTENAPLLQDSDLINEVAFQWMKKNAKRRVREKDRGKQKLLDGMDSVILIYLNELALENEKDIVVLYTADYPLWRIFSRIWSHHKDWFQQNTGAVCALFPVECPRCHHNNPHDILRRTRLSCQNCGGFPLR